MPSFYRFRHLLEDLRVSEVELAEYYVLWLIRRHAAPPYCCRQVCSTSEDLQEAAINFVSIGGRYTNFCLKLRLCTWNRASDAAFIGRCGPNALWQFNILSLSMLSFSLAFAAFAFVLFGCPSRVARTMNRTMGATAEFTSMCSLRIERTNCVTSIFVSTEFVAQLGPADVIIITPIRALHIRPCRALSFFGLRELWCL